MHTIPDYIFAYVTAENVVSTSLVDMWRQTQEAQKIEFEEKFKRIENEGTQEFMSTGRVNLCNPPTFQYIHLNTSKTFNSEHSMLEDAVAEYLADPDRDLPMDELLYKLMKGRVEQKAKVFMQTCGKNTDLKLEELQEKLARIDTYGSNFSFSFNSFIERCSNGKSANGTRDPCEALSLLNFVYI